jgi:hypothetical protein
MITRMVFQTTIWLAAMAAILFLAAGDWGWPQGWVFRGGVAISNTVGPVGDRALLPLDLHAHLPGGETVEAKHLPNDDHAKRDQDSPDCLRAKWNARPPEATSVQGAQHQPTDEEKQAQEHEGAVPGPLITLHRRGEA